MFYFHDISSEFVLHESVLPSAPSFICSILSVSDMLETSFSVIFHNRSSARKTEIAAEGMWTISIFYLDFFFLHLSFPNFGVFFVIFRAESMLIFLLFRL